MSLEVENVVRAGVIIAVFTIWACVFAFTARRPRKSTEQEPETWDDRTQYGVEGDLALDDGRPTDPGEEITEVSRYDWSDESGSMPSAAEELRGGNRGGS